MSSARGRTLRTAPWRRAPVLLLRQPAVVAAIVLAAAVLSLAASSAPLFLSTIGTASLHEASAQRCAEQAMPSVGLTSAASPYGEPYTAKTNATLGAQVAAAYGAHGLPAPTNVVWGQSFLFANAPVTETRNLPATLFASPGALNHVQKVSSAGGSGVWINSQLAQQSGLRAGMTMRLGANPIPDEAALATGGTSVRIAGTYQSLADPLDPSRPLPSYWCSWKAQVIPSILLNTPPTFIIVDDPDYVIGASHELHSNWYSPVGVAHRTLAQATSQALAGDAAGTLASAQNANRPILVDHSYSRMTLRARHVQSGLSGAIVPIAGGGVVVAMLLIAGAGWFWALRRRREITMLISRGIGPSALGAKAVLETAPWIVVGGAGGLGLTVLLVRRLGPTPMLEAGATLRAVGLIALVVAAAVGVVAVIGAAVGREVAVFGRLNLRWSRFVPWEIGLLGAAFAVYATAHGRGITVDDQATVQLGPAVLAFPLLGFVGALLLITRLLRRGMPALRRVAGRSRMSTFLAFTRIASSPAVTLGVLVGIALPCGMLVYASGLERSLHASVQAKYETNLGAPHVLNTVYGSPRDLALAGTGTQVTVIQQAPVTDSGEPVRILGVDPATFAKFAYVHGAQRSQVSALGRPGPDGMVKAIIANPRGLGRVHYVDVQDVRLNLDVVATTEAFPGLRDPYQPMIVVDRTALNTMPVHIERAEQVWTDNRSKPGAIAALGRQHVTVLYELTPQVLVSTTGLLPVTWVLSYLRALALLIGLVAMAGLVFALAARAKRTAVAYILTRRMGVPRRTHLASLVTELALVVGCGWLAGTALAEGSVGVVYRLLDTYPQFPPVPRFVLDGAIVVITAAAAAVLLLAAAALAQLFADRARPSDTMRAL